MFRTENIRAGNMNLCIPCMKWSCLSVCPSTCIASETTEFHTGGGGLHQTLSSGFHRPNRTVLLFLSGLRPRLD